MRSIPFVHAIAFVALAAACAGSDRPPAEEPIAGSEAEPPADPDTTSPEAPETAETPTAPETPAAPETPPAPEPKTLSEDLDGDGTPEAISLTGTDLTIGEVAVALPADKLAGKVLEIKVVDLSSKDRSRELVVVDPGTEDDAVWYLVTWAKGKAGAPVEVPVGSEPTLKGDGSLTVVSTNCGETTTTTWKLSKGKITAGKPKKKGKHDPARCAG
ncbi:MAG TPA: hypothetical protein VFU21_02105 [Kofleriaceae bacterium]|nr:hypothetical protein [Kofleriaceae bacterium]